ncbi:activating signal cointegrator 1 [Trichonephila inaurata madagascariensis]|uniref:Activating signal cointegrator 1 n=1 Tax=Trichonephila inaurata madagascariensis TaxID=2747483 RepID=A0A8X6XMK4_9ARAC|nr:activating signal cointegrator 1 [Trichonephila inaurata madagascariensis]
MMKKSGKHSTKYLPLSSADIAKEKILLPGRRPCTCEAVKHGLINNCLECGRIICDQEGSGPCFTCGNLVCTPKEQEAIIRQSKTGIKLYNKLMNLKFETNEMKDIPRANDNKLKSALEHRDKLLEYDRTVEKRMKVIDDENDYFQVDSKWLSEKERKILNKKKEEFYDMLHNNKSKSFTFDFAGRKVVEEKPNLNIDVDELLKSDTSIFECDTKTMASTFNIPPDLQLVYQEDNDGNDYVAPSSREENKRLNIRIQDKELQEMSDEGHCLSLHQPYASLLVAGIKKHEGRVWYTSYRGRLWIHSAGKIPTKQDIADLENMYRHIYDDCEFPKSYPHGCLLGCVDLVDCLPQDEYKIQYPEGEIASPYVFICENAQELSIKFPMKGKHKIFKLDGNIHLAAKKTLMKKL